MRILSIETSADETAVSLVETTGDFPHASYTILGNTLRSQIELHNEYGGIYPTMAKREHAKALPVLLEETLQNADALVSEPCNISQALTEQLTILLVREPGLAETLSTFITTHQRPEIDLIARLICTLPGTPFGSFRP